MPASRTKGFNLPKTSKETKEWLRLNTLGGA